MRREFVQRVNVETTNAYLATIRVYSKIVGKNTEKHYKNIKAVGKQVLK